MTIKPSTAHYRLSFAMKNGTIVKDDNCAICGVPPGFRPTDNLVAHHEDYDKPLEIVTLCKSCHKRLHLGKLAYHSKSKGIN